MRERRAAGGRAGKLGEGWETAARVGAVKTPRAALELRVRAARPGMVGVALALGFALLWAFLLLGVVAPASGL